MDIEENDNQNPRQQPIIPYEGDQPLQLTQQLGQANQLLVKQNVKCQIQTKKNSIDFIGNLQVYEDDYHLVAGDLDIGIDYRITGSLGTNATTLMIFVDSENKEDQEEGIAEEAYLEEENVGDEVLQLIKSEGKGNFFLRGSCTIVIHFLTHEEMQEAYTKISEQLGEQEEWNSQYACDDHMERMICADDIDEDGNIIKGPALDDNESDEMEGEENSQMVDENQQV